LPAKASLVLVGLVGFNPAGAMIASPFRRQLKAQALEVEAHDALAR